MGRKRIARTTPEHFHDLASATVAAVKRSREDEAAGKLGWYVYELQRPGAATVYVIARSQSEAMLKYVDVLQAVARRTSAAEARDALLAAAESGAV